MSGEQRSWRVMNLALGLDEPESGLIDQACEAAGVGRESLRGFRIAHKALDARRSRSGGRRFRLLIHADLVLDADYSSTSFDEAKKSGRVVARPPAGRLEVPNGEIQSPSLRIAIVGAGPAGLFAALVLARSGRQVDLIERGGSLVERGRALAAFYNTRVPNPESNLLFGEGGAGTYSDGKLYTRVDDPLVQPILEELVECGAPPEIVYDARAHIGTDRLHRILPALRVALESAGVRFHWNTRVTGLVIAPDTPRRVSAVQTDEGEIGCDAAILALGHSARDTWQKLAEQGVEIEARATQLGVRIEHPQALIDRGRYGEGPEAARLGAAYYGLVCKASPKGPGAYSFCMCPGGQIVASVNEPGLLCTNGMSNSRHSSRYANAAIVTPVGPREFGPGVFAGVDYQRKLEAAFFAAGGGDYTAPAQRASDFLKGRASTSLEHTSFKFGVTSARIDRLLAPELVAPIARALEVFERRIPGFAGSGGMLVGVETRCSAPLRIPRDPQSLRARGFSNLHPVGEGAGYAGGILSAAVDGARSAQALLRNPAGG